MRLVRNNSTPIQSYNEGLVVFLYDDANTDLIEKASPSILEGFGEDDATDPKLSDLATAGVLVVFELQGDGDLSIELAVGEPLTEVEIAEGGWSLPMQRARLKLPSGKLRIECYKTYSLIHIRRKVRLARRYRSCQATTHYPSIAVIF